MQVSLKKGILDVLYLILKRSIYDVLRFRSVEKQRHQWSLVSILLHQLDIAKELFISKRLIRLIGVVAQVNITAKELKNFLERLKSPSELALSLLQAFKMMLKQDESSSKYTHTSFFSFGGTNAGLFSHYSSVFINKDLQVSMWFRIESLSSAKTQHLLWCSNDENQCVDIFIHDKTLGFYVDSQGPALTLVLDLTLRAGTWYYLHVSFIRHRWSLFNRNQLTINLDSKVVFQEFVKLPKFALKGEDDGTTPKLAIGHHFNGQVVFLRS